MPKTKGQEIVFGIMMVKDLIIEYSQRLSGFGTKL